MTLPTDIRETYKVMAIPFGAAPSRLRRRAASRLAHSASVAIA